MFYTIAHSIKNLFGDKDENDASVGDKPVFIEFTGVEVDNKEVTIEKKMTKLQKRLVQWLMRELRH